MIGHHKFYQTILLLISGLLLLNCSGDEVTGTGNNVRGTAASNAPLTTTKISLRATSGAAVSTTTDDQGVYTIAVNELAAPYLIRAELADGTMLYSVATEAGVNNITPLSDAISRNWFSTRNRDIDNEFARTDAISSLPSFSEFDLLIDSMSNLIADIYNGFNLNRDFDFIHEKYDNDYSRFIAKTQVAISNQLLNITIETASQQSVSILIDFDLGNDLSDDASVAPSQPQGLSTAASLDSLQLQWNASRDNRGVSYYNVYRSASVDGNYQFLADAIFPQFSDTNLASGEQYCYKIEAVDNSEGTSPLSTAYCATTESLPQCATRDGSTFMSIGSSTDMVVHWPLDTTDNSLGYSWVVTQKPTDSLYQISTNDSQAANFVFTPDVIGNYSFRLIITGNSLGCPSITEVTYIRVEAALLADAGLDQSTLVGMPVTLDNVPAIQGQIIRKWRVLSGPAGYFPLIDYSASGRRYTPNLAGSYEIQLLVQNDFGSSAQDTMTLTVSAAVGPALLPIASGGMNKQVILGDLVMLDIVGSYDPGNSAATLTGDWTFYLEPPGSTGTPPMGTSSDNQWAFTPNTLGDYIMKLTVSNSSNISHPYYITITVIQ